MVWDDFWSKHDFEVLSIPEFGGDQGGMGWDQGGFTTPSLRDTPPREGNQPQNSPPLEGCPEGTGWSLFLSFNLGNQAENPWTVTLTGSLKF